MKGEKTTIGEGKQFLGLFERLRKIGLKMNLNFQALIRKILSDFADRYEKEHGKD